LQVSNADKFVASVCRAFLGCQIEKAVDELNLKKKIISCHPSRLKNGTTVLSAELGNARLDGFWGKGGAIGGIASRVKSGMPVDNPDSRYRLAYGFRRPASRFHEFSQERKRMKKLAGAVLLLCACAGLVFAQTQMSPAATPAKGPGVAQGVKQLEHDWLDAMKAGDIDKLSSIMADDWVGIGFGDGKATKQSYLADVKSGTSKMESFEIGPMDVKVLGNVAVVQGSDTEKSSYKGKDTSGKWIWMDVFVKRDGKWVAVRSQDGMVK
jgi:ketosteroid isomerase-like protein